MNPEVKKGFCVLSKKGRDKDRVFVVLYMLDADFAYIADGRTHKMEHPKRKKVKHLRAMPFEFPKLCEMYEQHTLKNSDIREALASVLPEKAVE